MLCAFTATLTFAHQNLICSSLGPSGHLYQICRNSQKVFLRYRVGEPFTCLCPGAHWPAIRPCLQVIQQCLLRGAVAAGKENAHGGVMSDEEEEGVIREEHVRNHYRAFRHDSSSGSSSFGSLLVHLQESLVDDFWQNQVAGGRHACHRGENPLLYHAL